MKNLRKYPKKTGKTMERLVKTMENLRKYQKKLGKPWKM
jgi:hypothetical protein